ncbi:MAG: septum formation initiator family protein [Streptosporangiaceae bacterium]
MTQPPEAKTPRPEPAGGRSRPNLTSRAAILAVVMCAIALSLAYPIKEYVAQRNEIQDLTRDQTVAQRQVEDLIRKKERLSEPAYVKGEARRRLHFCDPGEKCYVELDGSGGAGRKDQQSGEPKAPPWYQTLWKSVEAADGR